MNPRDPLPLADSAVATISGLLGPVIFAGARQQRTRRPDNGRIMQGLEGIVLMARQVDELISGIAEASRPQNRGIEDINRTVVGLRQTTQLNAAGAEESPSAATEFDSQAGSLEEAAPALALLVGAKQGISRAA